MAVTGRPPKRARVTAEPRPLDMRAFPGGGGGGEGWMETGGGGGAFRDRVRAFLARCAVPSGGAWRVGLRAGDEDGKLAAAAMEVVEEDVARAAAARIYCEQCTVAGWSRHPVCGKRYHFIIRNEHGGMQDYKTCRHCGFMVQLFETWCPSCKHGASYDDPEDWDYMQLDNPRHLLHGIVHENGFGHLVRVNGREGGSSLLTGYEIMDFWDRLCKYLRVRKVSLMDVSKKYGTDYRVLHAVATGFSWYSQWGFKLSRGSFGITPEEYGKAVRSLSSVPLSHFFQHSRSPRNQLQDTIAFYQALSTRPLTTIGELFFYMLELANSKGVHNHFGSIHKKEHPFAHSQEPSWPDEEIKRATDIALKVLCAVGTRWVAKRTLKAAISHSIGSPQLVDYCLKTLGSRSVDEMVIAVRCNSETHTIEYRISDVFIPMQNACLPAREHLIRDIKFLFDMLLHPHTMHPYKPVNIHADAKRSAMVLLDCKQFKKHYDLEEDFLPKNSSLLHIWCQVELLDQVEDPPCIPLELLTLKHTATVSDLKVEAARTFHDIYLMLQTFVVNQILDCRTASESTQVKLLFGTNGTVRVQGKCIGVERRVAIYRMERGVDKWIVDCSCGAKDDDGERMLSCDSCYVWQHTRCSGISDFNQVPKRYVCHTCELLHKPKSSQPRITFSLAPNKRCKTDTSTFIHVRGEFLKPHIR